MPLPSSLERAPGKGDVIVLRRDVPAELLVAGITYELTAFEVNVPQVDAGAMDGALTHHVPAAREGEPERPSRRGRACSDSLDQDTAGIGTIADDPEIVAVADRSAPVPVLDPV